MNLEVQFSNGVRLPAREAVLSRALGRAVRWRYEFYAPLIRQRDDLQKLVDDLGSKRITAQAGFNGSQSVEFGLEGVVTHAWWGDDADHVVVEVQNTRLGEEDPNPLLPRWRIHHVDDLHKLAQKFGHLVSMGGAPVKNALSAVTFPDAERANVVQAGVSDWDFVATLLWQYRLLGKDEKLKPMILTGSVDPGSESKWVYTWGARGAFEAAGEVSKRTVTLAETDGYWRPMFAGGTGDETGRHGVVPGADVPRAGLLRHRRPFSGGAWQAWRSRDVPMFVEGTMCWRVVDRLYATGHPDHVGWTTMFEFMPPEGMVPQEFPPLAPRAWMGEGKVKKNYVKGPWIDIELPAFVNEKQENVVHTRLTTIHSGKMGHAGLHLIPEQDTEVEVAWSGRFDQSVLCVGNRRMKETVYPHPSWWIESDSIGQYADIVVKSLGKTDIESDWKIDVEKQTMIRSTNPMKLIGDGIKAHYTGGIIHISKGSPASFRAARVEDADRISAMADTGTTAPAARKMSLEEHVVLMKAAQAQGTQTIQVTNPAGVTHKVNVHGASPTEFAQIETAVKDLAKLDKYNLLLTPLSDVFVTDALSGGHGSATAGVAIKRDGGGTDIMLSRMKGQAKVNKLERVTHVKEVLYHELGHALDNKHDLSRARPDDVFGEGDRASHGPMGDFVSKYAGDHDNATTRRREDYAETFAHYHVARTNPAMAGLSDKEVIDMTCFGGKSGTKMEKMAGDLGPQVHCQDAMTEYLDKNEGVGPRQVVRKFYDDPDFRQGYVQNVTASKPGTPREAVYNHMEGVANLFGESPTPGG